jgi:hypothetical protein
MSTVNNGPQIVRSGLVLGLDASNMRSYSPNVLPNPTDIFAWAGINSANAAVLSRDTSMTRQYGSIPMKMAITGNDPFTNTVNYGPGALSTWNLAPAANGQTWTISVYVKASVATTGELFFLPADSNGVAITSASGAVTITTSWSRVSFTYTISSATTAFIQARLDGTPTSGSGITIWWDGLQVERASAATTFNPYYFGNTSWRDISGNGYHFTIDDPRAYSITDGIKHMNFEGSYGVARRLVSGVLTDVPNFLNGTILIFSSLLNANANWRTLTRGAANDHQVIIQQGGNTLGMFDNNSGTFVTSGFDTDTIPNRYTKFNFLCWRLSQNSPYYQFQYNDNASITTITNVLATFNNGFATIGGISNPDQYWGKISAFLYYDRHLSQSEISQNYQAFKSKFVI